MSDAPLRSQHTPQSQQQARAAEQKRPTEHAARPAARIEARPATAQSLGIEPVAADSNDPSIVFDWRPVAVGAAGSYSCTVTTSEGDSLTVTIEQLPYLKTLQGTGSLTVVAIPVGSDGATGKLIARNDTTGREAGFTWQWHRRRKGGDVTSSRAGPLALLANLMKKIAALASGTDATHAGPVEDAAGTDAFGMSAGSPFDGDWHYLGPFKPWSVRITGTVGICTLSNAPHVYATGDTMLYIDAVEEKSFVGRIIYTDGKFRKIAVTLVAPDRLETRLVVKDYAEDACVLHRR